MRRVSVLKDMIQAFMEPDVLFSSIEIIMINEFGKEELGLDNGGVFRDTLSAFWDAFYNSCTTGEDQRVPTLRHDFRYTEWEAIARIFVVGFKELKYLPFKMCKSFIVVCLFGEESVSDEMLLESFKAYISQDERELVTKAVNASMNEEMQSEWLDFLDRFSCKRVPNGDPASIKMVLLELAHKELIQESNYIIESWVGPFKRLRNCPEFESVEKVEELYGNARPSTKKVLDLFLACPVTNAERDALAYLKRYIRGLNQEKLCAFLRFCTGASAICVSNIEVMFTRLDGVARRLIAHTCGPIVELPCTYTSFPQFREELNNILSCNFWDIDFA